MNEACRRSHHFDTFLRRRNLERDLAISNGRRGPGKRREVGGEEERVWKKDSTYWDD